MNLSVVTTDITQLEVDGLIVNLFEGIEEPSGATGAIDKALDGVISQLIADREIRGKPNETTLIHTMGRIPAKRVVVVGLGKAESLTLDRIRQAVGEASRLLRDKQAKRIASILHGAGSGGIDPEEAAQAITEGAILGLYEFKKYKTKEAEHGDLEEFLLVERDEERGKALEQGIARGTILAEATCLARDLVNEPSSAMTPTDLAELARETASKYGLEFTVLDREQMEALGMGGLLGVARGSQQPPKFIILQYKGDSASSETLGLIGKAITFDSGGISIKPSEGMGEMKGDMSGGAAVISAMCALGQLKPRINVTALIPATENLPSGSAYKPGDVLKAMNGKTMEIANTDAEGRLILADALSYARKEGLSPLIDVATLTGACHIALGDINTGVFANNQELADRILRLSKVTGEGMWQMPMDEEYKKLNKSDIADVKNTGGRYGGAITAAQFLAEFSEDTPWVHLDIAGTFLCKNGKGYTVKGGTGVGVRTLVALAMDMAQEAES
jgi:leucyl aminopeptidase